MSQAIKSLKRLSNCAVKASYEYTDAERDEALAAVEEAYRLMRARFLQSEPTAKAQQRFSWEANGSSSD